MSPRRIARVMIFITCLGASALGLAPSASAWESMRCGTRLIDVGDPLYKVKALCGDPDQEDQRVEYRSERVRVRTVCRPSGGRQVCQDIYNERTVEVPIHRLTYDFGRNRFVHYLHFEFSRLVYVESGDYGIKD